VPNAVVHQAIFGAFDGVPCGVGSKAASAQPASPYTLCAQALKMTHENVVVMRAFLDVRPLADVLDAGATGSTRGGTEIMNATTKRQISPRVRIVGLTLALSACTNPYDPVQRTIGGGLIGAGSGAAIGAAAASGHGAALGAAVGGTVGAVGGLITTPPRYRY
jgi:hypothetical protein